MIGPFDNKVEAGKMTWVFAIGVAGQDLAIVRHVIPLRESKGSKRPKNVATGSGGQAAELAAHGTRPR
ncbi:MAG TPA: hypothetical protein VE476_07205 [Propionibacteriaceae bacterium]|nr:hypothetical protein [Propionibacteriaceae bacterium]